MKKMLVVSLVLFASLFAGCSDSSAGDGTYQVISAQEAKEMMDEASSYVLVDVRTREEFDQGHIDGAILIPDTEISARAESELKDKDELILVYCRSGVRAARASQALVDLGYTKVYDMGGILDWPFGTVGA